LFLQKLSNGYITCKQFFLSCNRRLPCNATRYIDGILAVKLKAVYVHYITVFTIGVVVLLLPHSQGHNPQGQYKVQAMNTLGHKYWFKGHGVNIPVEN